MPIVRDGDCFDVTPDFFDDVIGRGCSGCQTHGPGSFEPHGLQLGRPRDLVGGLAEPAGQFRQLAAVVAFRSADHDYHIAFVREGLQCLLAILRWLANGVDEADIGLGVAAADSTDYLQNVIDGLCRLSDDTEARSADERVQVGFVSDNGEFGKIADQTANFDMAGLADDDRVAFLPKQAGDGEVYTFHERARRIVNLKSPVDDVLFHCVGGAVGGEQHEAGANLTLFANPHGAGGFHLADHVGIVNQVAEYGNWSSLREV
jgi:hypothetical protein